MGLDPVFIYRHLKTVNDGIQTDPFPDSPISLCLKSGQQPGLVVPVKTVHDLVCKANKSIDVENWLPKVMV